MSAPASDPAPVRLLHTSDWHLGRRLFGRSRHDEFAAFLDWLADTLAREAVDVLLVAGDVFDTTTPGTRTQQLYYRFLHRVAAGLCRHVVIVGGNHDSPSLLDAPRELLAALRVHVVGAPAADPADEVLVLDDAHGRPALIVAAVPYLRDRDLRQSEPGEQAEDKTRKLLAGLRAHYAAVCAAAEARRAELGGALPLVATGHLFTAGGRTVEGDGVRELYVGNLAHIGADQFPPGIDYLALGHLHVPQVVGGDPSRRYSGSPLPMGFGEAEQQKQVCLAEFRGRQARVRELPVPVFRRLRQLRGDWPALQAALRDLAAAGEPEWLEVVYEGEEIVADLRQRLAAEVEGSPLEILRVRNDRLVARALARQHPAETLDALDPETVFQRCLDAHEVPAAQRPALQQTYREALQALREAEPAAD